MTASLSTPLCELLGCRYPIVQTAMGWVAGPPLVAATGNAGGFGFLAGATIAGEQLADDILTIKKLSNAPFGINFHMYQPNAAQIVDLVIEHQVAAVSYSRSPDAALIKKLKDHQVICMPTVGLPKHVAKAIDLGADAITVQGSEGGGHTGAVPTSLLIPEVVKLAKGRVPVAAAGGFQDGRGLVAALAWGASGIAMGTRFFMSHESSPPAVTKQCYVDCQDPAQVIVSKALDGLPQRMINNTTLAKLEHANALQMLWLAARNALAYRQFTGASLLSLLKAGWAMSRDSEISFAQAIMSANAPMIIQKSMVDGQPNKGVLPSGQVAGVISEIQSCEQIIQSIMHQAQECLDALAQLRS